MQTNTKRISTARIVSITECGEESVYNMEVADNHNFAINGGVVVHNCMDAMRYWVKTNRIAKVERQYISPIFGKVY